MVADLIMLGLATHEPNFTIIREEFKPNKPKPCALCNQMGHEVKDCQGLPREKQGKVRILLFLGFLPSVGDSQIVLAVGFSWSTVQTVAGNTFLYLEMQKWRAKPDVHTCGVLSFGVFPTEQEQRISNWTDVQSSEMQAWHKGLGACFWVSPNSCWSSGAGEALGCFSRCCFLCVMWILCGFSTINLPTPCRSRSRSSSSSACVSWERWGAAAAGCKCYPSPVQCSLSSFFCSVCCSTWRESSPWPACLSLLILKGASMTGSSCASSWGMTSSLTCHLWRSGRWESCFLSLQEQLLCLSLPGVSPCALCLGREPSIAWLTSIKTWCTKPGWEFFPFPFKTSWSLPQRGLAFQLCCSLTCRATWLKVGLWTCSESRWSCWLLGKLKTVFSKRGKMTM